MYEMCEEIKHSKIKRRALQLGVMGLLAIVNFPVYAQDGNEV